MARSSSPKAAVSSANIDTAAMSSARRCIAASRSTGPSCRASNAWQAVSAQPAMWPASGATARGVKAGAMARRCRRHASPSLTSRPRPTIGPSTRRTASSRP